MATEDDERVREKQGWRSITSIKERRNKAGEKLKKKEQRR